MYYTVYAMVKCDGTVRRNFIVDRDTPAQELREASLVIAKDVGKFRVLKDRYAYKRFRELTQDEAETLIKEHVARAKV